METGQWKIMQIYKLRDTFIGMAFGLTNDVDVAPGG